MIAVFNAMKLRTIFEILLLCLFLNAISCQVLHKNNKTDSVEQAEKTLNKQRAKAAKAAVKERKKAKKAFWKNQSKSARKSIRKNTRRMRKNS